MTDRLTTDPNDPRLGHGRPGGEGMNETYLILSDQERAKGFIRPLRYGYKHETCGTFTYMGTALAETYAARPWFYGATYCVACRSHFPVGESGEFVWKGTEIKVGT